MTDLKYAPYGTPFYCVIQYLSGINRVQKLLAGYNGEFFQRDDGTWMIRGMYCRAFQYNELADAIAYSRNKNDKRLKASEDMVKYYQGRVYNISKHIFAVDTGAKRP